MPNKAKAERVYYMVTRAGLHVGQNASKGGLFGRSAAVDHFLPRESIVGSDTDHQDSTESSTKIVARSDLYGVWGSDAAAAPPLMSWSEDRCSVCLVRCGADGPHLHGHVGTIIYEVLVVTIEGVIFRSCEDAPSRCLPPDIPD